MRHPDVKTLLAQHGLRAKKSWGQNFLLDARVLERIADACRTTHEDVVVEIGAGLGHLTRALAERAGHVVAIERDRDLARVLRAEFAVLPKVEIAEENAVTFDFARAAARFGRLLVVAGNLPYHLSSQILVHLLDARAHLRRLVLMFQKELAERIAARAGSRDYGTLSVLAQAHADIEVVLTVPRGAFHPAPKIRSAVLRFELLPEPRAPLGDETLFRAVVHAAFSQRRKTIRNSLVGGLREKTAAGTIDTALAEAGIDPGARAETLSVERFAALSRALFRTSGASPGPTGPA